MVSDLTKVAICTDKLQPKSQTLINHRCVCGALNRQYCQTRVQAKPSVSFRVAFRFKATDKTMIVSPLKLKNHGKTESKICESIADARKSDGGLG
jgi:hypothetical protein